METDVLVVGAGPAGSSAAAWAARAGLDVVLADAAHFPRDKPCGDGLTPRAVSELMRLGMGEWLTGRARNVGLRAAGFGRVLTLPWPGGSLPDYGSAVPRLILDAGIREVACAAGARPLAGARAVSVELDAGRIRSVGFTVSPAGEGSRRAPLQVHCRRVIVADGARSQLGRLLGRTWHRSTAYGVAARGYIDSGRSADSWISSHLELRDERGHLLSGYGWIFPLGNGQVNIGVGTLATERRPAAVGLHGLMAHYASAQRGEWELRGEVTTVASALLPMGGAVSGVAGSNWLLIGDAAGCVNPLNGEGIDYGLETGRLAAEVMAASAPGSSDWTRMWPDLLRGTYGPAFSVARRLAGLLTVPGMLTGLGPVGMRSGRLMGVALRVMGNLITEEDRDVVARLWRTAGRASSHVDPRPPFS